jgi:hypothetical protein
MVTGEPDAYNVAPVDPVDMRGVPVIGRGVQGAIRGARPDRD